MSRRERKPTERGAPPSGEKKTASVSRPRYAVDLTVDQNPDLPEEMARIVSAGGFVKPSAGPGHSARVYLDAGHTRVGLAMARSLGDNCVSVVGVTCDPVVVEYDLQDEDLFLIVASDGIWEFIPSRDAVALAAGEVLGASPDATAACQELILEAASKWSEEEVDYRDDITCIIIRVNPLDRTKTRAAYLPVEADEMAHLRVAGRRESTSDLRMPEGRNSILLDTLGRGVVDTVGIDTVGDGVADTFYPAVAVDTDGDGKVDNVEVTTSLARKSSNIENGGASDRASTKDEFHRKQRELAALVAKVDAEAFTPRSDDADDGEDGGD